MCFQSIPLTKAHSLTLSHRPIASRFGLVATLLMSMSLFPKSLSDPWGQKQEKSYSPPLIPAPSTVFRTWHMINKYLLSEQLFLFSLYLNCQFPGASLVGIMQKQWRIFFFQESLPSTKKTMIQFKIFKFDLGKTARGNGKKGKRKRRLGNYALLIQNCRCLDVTSMPYRLGDLGNLILMGWVLHL